MSLFYLNIPINRYLIIFAISDTTAIKILTPNPSPIHVNIVVNYIYGSGVDKSKVGIFEILIDNNKVSWECHYILLPVA